MRSVKYMGHLFSHQPTSACTDFRYRICTHFLPNLIRSHTVDRLRLLKGTCRDGMRRRFFVRVAICLDANTEKVEHSTRLQRWEFHNFRALTEASAMPGSAGRRDNTRFRIAGLQMSVRSPAATSLPCRSRWVLALYPGNDMIRGVGPLRRVNSPRPCILKMLLFFSPTSIKTGYYLPSAAGASEVRCHSSHTYRVHRESSC